MNVSTVFHDMDQEHKVGKKLISSECLAQLGNN